MYWMCEVSGELSVIQIIENPNLHPPSVRHCGAVRNHGWNARRTKHFLGAVAKLSCLYVRPSVPCPHGTACVHWRKFNEF